MEGISRKLMTIVKAALFFAVAGCCGACCQKDLCYPDEFSPSEPATVVDVRFHWEHAGEAMVEGMSACFFPLSPGGRIWRFEIPGMNGGAVALPPGDYVMVAANNDLPGTDIYVGDVPESVVATTRDGDDGALRASGMLYGAVARDISVPSEISITDSHAPRMTIDVSPDSLATVYNVILKDVARTDMIESIYARISGVALTRNIYYDQAGDTSGSVNIPVDITGSIMSGSTTGLGTPSGQPDFTLTLYARLADRRKIARSLTFDITEQVTAAADPHNVYIVLTGVDFDSGEPGEPAGGDGVGMDVDVDGWSGITIDLITGK